MSKQMGLKKRQIRESFAKRVKKSENQFIYQFVIILILPISLASSSANSVVEKIDCKDYQITIIFNVNIDTTVEIHPTIISVFPDLFGRWRWRSNHELIFIADSIIPDTTVYILTIHPNLRDILGNTVGNMDFIITASNSIFYCIQKEPPQWEEITRWDAETDWEHGPKVYTIKPKLHTSYRPVMDVLFCWDHIFHGLLRKDHAIHGYPHFASSINKYYQATVDTSGALYLIDRLYGLRYRWIFFPENQHYWALDVSDKGEILIASSSNFADTTATVFLVDPSGNMIWKKNFFTRSNNDKIFDLHFVNNLDRFLIYMNEKIYYFKLKRN